MDNLDAETPFHRTRLKIIQQFQDALESMEWQNRQVIDKVVLGRQHLTLSQMTVLRVLSESETDIEMREVASRSGLPHGSTVSVMDRLVLRRFAERLETPGASCVMCRISPGGVEALQNIRQSRLDLVERTLEGYSDDDVKLLRDLIQRWADIAAEIIAEEEEATAESGVTPSRVM